MEWFCDDEHVGRLELKDVAGSCVQNAAAAATVGRADLVQVWTLAAIAAAREEAEEKDSLPWSSHPFSKPQMDHLYVLIICDTYVIFTCD